MPRSAAHLENSPLPLPGSPTIPISLILLLSVLSRPDPARPPQPVPRLATSSSNESGATAPRHPLLEDQRDLAGLARDPRDLVLEPPEEGHDRLEPGQAAVGIRGAQKRERRPDPVREVGSRGGWDSVPIAP